MGQEGIAELRERLALLREMGAKSHDPATGAVEFFAPGAPPQPPPAAPSGVQSMWLSQARRLYDEAVQYGSAEGLPDSFEDFCKSLPGYGEQGEARQ